MSDRWGETIEGQGEWAEKRLRVSERAKAGDAPHGENDPKYVYHSFTH